MNPEKSSFNAEKTVDPMECYEDIEVMLWGEQLEDNVDEVYEQIQKLRKLIKKHEELKEAHKNDSGMDIHVDESYLNIVDALEQFHINGVVVDIQKLSNRGPIHKDIFNDLVFHFNNYFDCRADLHETPIQEY
jgi:hypothetical protein